jgi:hypothetical protein
VFIDRLYVLVGWSVRSGPGWSRPEVRWAHSASENTDDVCNGVPPAAIYSSANHVTSLVRLRYAIQFVVLCGWPALAGCSGGWSYCETRLLTWPVEMQSGKKIAETLVLMVRRPSAITSPQNFQDQPGIEKQSPRCMFSTTTPEPPHQACCCPYRWSGEVVVSPLA